MGGGAMFPGKRCDDQQDLLPHHSVGALPDVREVAVARPDVEGLPTDQLGSRPGASSRRHRSCRHYGIPDLNALNSQKKKKDVNPVTSTSLPALR